MIRRNDKVRHVVTKRVGVVVGARCPDDGHRLVKFKGIANLLDVRVEELEKINA